MGNAGSGKSTLAKRLGEELYLPVYHLDRELLHGNFEKHLLDERIRRHDALIERDEWIIDGNYRDILPERIERATVIVFLNVPRLRAIRQLFLRNRSGTRVEESVPTGARNRVTWKLLKWTLRYSRRSRLRLLNEAVRGLPIPVIVLKSAPIEDWIALIKKRLN